MTGDENTLVCSAPPSGKRWAQEEIFGESPIERSPVFVDWLSTCVTQL